MLVRTWIPKTSNEDMERILNLKTSSATEFLHDIRKTHSTFMQFTLHALLFNVAMTELRLSPLWRMPPSQSNTGDVSIMVVWVVPFFSLLWFTINWTSITEKRESTSAHCTRISKRSVRLCTLKGVNWVLEEAAEQGK